MGRITRKRLTEVFLSIQTFFITILLYWTYLESRSNAFFGAWLSQNFPLGLTLLNEWSVTGAVIGLLLVTSYWIIKLEEEGKRRKVKLTPPPEAPFHPELETRPVLPGPTVPKRRPIYETVELRSLAWYVHQFPGEFAFVGQLVSVAGIDPFQLMRFYPLGLSLVVVFLAYVIARAYSPQYASIASAVLLGGLWFQLHVSPQSLELVLYLGIILLLVKIIDDEPRRKLWTTLAILSAPIFV